MSDETTPLDVTWRTVTHAWERDPGDPAPRPVPSPIPPALTADEWGAIAHFKTKDEWPDRDLSERIQAHAYWTFERGHDRATGAAALVALANDARADDDPGKITHEGVFALEQVLANFRAFALTAGGDNPALVAQYYDDAERQIAALAALLPPADRT